MGYRDPDPVYRKPRPNKNKEIKVEERPEARAYNYANEDLYESEEVEEMQEITYIRKQFFNFCSK